ncbi:hypothetical protein [Streptomyces sp. NPDC047043]|uniref:hypothetical protein n=1 Tax=Streptomyces sp. NPDC047043 TaxID=3154497 RepID=UPI0033EEB860
MRIRTTGPRRLALGIAVLTAAALGTVSASAAQATGSSTANTRHTAESKSLKPGGFAVAYQPTSNAPDDLNSANDDFAGCMRDQGQTVFPRFHAAKDEEGHVRLEVKITGGNFDPTATAYKKAVRECGPILEKAGITFPKPGHPFPAPDPAKGAGEGGSTRIEPGRPGGPDLPSLTSTVEKA